MRPSQYVEGDEIVFKHSRSKHIQPPIIKIHSDTFTLQDYRFRSDEKRIEALYESCEQYRMFRRRPEHERDIETPVDVRDPTLVTKGDSPAEIRMTIEAVCSPRYHIGESIFFVNPAFQDVRTLVQLVGTIQAIHTRDFVSDEEGGQTHEASLTAPVYEVLFRDSDGQVRKIAVLERHILERNPPPSLTEVTLPRIRDILQSIHNTAPSSDQTWLPSIHDSLIVKHTSPQSLDTTGLPSIWESLSHKDKFEDQGSERKLWNPVTLSFVPPGRDVLEVFDQGLREFLL
ncbi:hypothetical protein BJ546DRAFT_433825 [Cryomyces antarcticus]